MPRDAITILHLSDMQFGKNHSFGTYGPERKAVAELTHDTLLAGLIQDLDDLKRDFGLQPDVVVVTGDLAEWGLESEFEQAREFLEGLAAHLGIAPEERYRIAIIPGNHDIDRWGAEQDWIGWKRRGKKGAPFGFTRWEYFAKMFEAFYAAVPKEGGLRPEFVNDRPYSRFVLPEHKLMFAGMNSTLAECHLETPETIEGISYGHHGYGGKPQWQHFAKELADYETQCWLRIGLIHHNLNRAFDKDEECLRHGDLQDLNSIVGPHLNLLLHGHTHSGDEDSLKNGVPVLSTGTPSLGDSQKPPGEPNQYQIIQLHPEGITTTHRAWNMKDGRFVTDGSKGGNKSPGVKTRDVPWKNAQATFPARLLIEGDEGDSGLKPGKRISAPREEEFMDAVMRSHGGHSPMLEQLESVCRLRYEEPDVSRRSDGPVPYLRIVTRSPFQRVFAVGALPEGLTEEGVNAFKKVHETFVQLDPHVENHLVYAGSVIPTTAQTLAAGSGFKVWSYHQFQRICSLTEAVEAQTRRLQSDTIYPPELYVDQEVSIYSRNYHRSGDAEIPESGLTRRKEALTAVSALLEDHAAPSFVLVHGDFGAGKTFLLRQLALKFHEAGNPLIPIFIELRSLEKDFSLDQHLAAHFARQGVDMPVIPKAALRYMLEQGHLLLLFDGYDELARNVTFDTAAQYLKNLAEAAGGRAKVVLTVRTQHFLYDRQMVEHLAGLPGFQRLRLEPFTEEQILQFLVNKFRMSKIGDEAAAKARLELLREVKDLLGLSQNPRMLSFIAELEEERLREAQTREKDGRISAGSLYQIILDQWLANEIKRRPDNRQKDEDRLKRLWLSVEKLALIAWPKQERVLDESECIEVAKQVISELLATQLHPREEAQAVASGSLLSREGDGRFAFAHQSILEWLVARVAARSIQADQNPEVLCQQEMTHLMADFLIDLLESPQQVFDWTLRMMNATEESTGKFGKSNAVLVTRRLGRVVDGVELKINQAKLSLAGQDLRGKNLDRQSFGHADLSDSDLSQSSLCHADLRNAKLIRANLTEADLSYADLRGANLMAACFTRATLIGTDLRGAEMTGSLWEMARLAGAMLDDPQLSGLQSWGAGLPDMHHQPALLSSASAVNAVAWSPREDVVATGHDNGLICMWDAHSGKPLQTLEAHSNWVRSLCFDAEGNRLASGSDDKTVRLWDAHSGKPLQTLQGHLGTVRSVCFDADGSRLASGSDDKTVRLWDAHSGKLLQTLEGHSGAVMSVCFDAEGSRLASGSYDNTVRLWDAHGGKPLQTLHGHTNWVMSVCFDAEGNRLASGSDDNTVRLWDAHGGKSLQTLHGHSGYVRSVCFNAEGSRIASGSDDNTLRVWDVHSGQCLQTFEGHSHWVRSVAFNAEGSRIVSGSDDNTLRVWDAHSGQCLQTLQGHSNSVLSVASNAEGSRIASGSYDKTLRVWDAHSGQCLQTLQGHSHWVRSVAFNAEGSRIASGSFDQTLCVWDAQSGKCLQALKGHKGTVLSVAFNAEGSRLASGSYDNTVGLWDTRSGKLLQTLEGHSGYVMSVGFNAEGSLLASGSYDKTVRLWDAHGGKPLQTLQGHSGTVTSVSFWQGGRVGGPALLVSASEDGTIRIWDAEAGLCLGILIAHGDAWAALRPDGRYRAVGNLQDYLWHVSGLVRYELGELDEVDPRLKLAEDEPLIPPAYFAK
ncbi:MAG: pentapeptide repeat-containing protein [Verrucomicrobiaceae bacterium]|nr:pentapeptide repeat-containing protein [Verrucomicrobiaceae bacterium]